MIDAYGADAALLDNGPALARILRAAVQNVGATVLQTHIEQFEPQGATVVLVLAESHASLHTYPEHGVYMADVFTCGDVSPEDAAREIAAALGGTATVQTIARGRQW